MALPENGRNAEKVLRRLDEQHNKYKYMELNLLAKRRRYDMWIEYVNFVLTR